MKHKEQEYLANEELIREALDLDKLDYQRIRLELMFKYISNYAMDLEEIYMRCLKSDTFFKWYCNQWNLNNRIFINRYSLKNSGSRLFNTIKLLESYWRLQSFNSETYYPNDRVVKMMQRGI